MTRPLPTTILLVRHADVHNPQDIVYGRLPRFGLSKMGREEAARTAVALAEERVAAVYSSPQLRARQTAGFLLAHRPGLRLHIARDLDEVKTGWQGTPNAIMAEKNYNFYRDRVNPDDEDVPEVVARLLRWVDRVARRHAGQTVIGVTHGDPSMMLRLHFLGQEVSMETLRQKDLYPAKGSITRLVFTGDGPAREQRPAVSYIDPSAAEHKALEAAAEAARAASAQESSAIPATEAPMGSSEEAARIP